MKTETTPERKVASPPGSDSFWRQLLAFLLEYNLVFIFLAIFVALAFSVRYFFTVQNMLGLALSVSQIGMVACTMMFCLASRDFDLSVGSIVAFAGVLSATVINFTDNLWAGVAAAGQAVGVSNADFIYFAGSSFLGISMPIWMTIACFVVFGFLLNSTVYGRNTLAIGGNPEAARLAGIHVERMRVVIFLVQGVIAGLAGVILASRITSGQPNSAQGFELNVISACVLGGVSLKGGSAAISGVIVGVFILGTAENVMNLLNIDAFYQYLVRGAILLAAVVVDQQRTRGD